MINYHILNTEIQDFVNNNLKSSIVTLALQKNPFPDIDWKLILQQIESKSKAKDKLPTWFKVTKIIYPPKLHIEQTSSEKTALYKSTLVFGEKLIDITGGFGVDTYYFSKIMNSVFHCEVNKDLSEIVNHNFEQLDCGNIITISKDSYDFLKETDEKFSWIYIDPSRRNDLKGKVFLLKDCLPNVPELLDFYFQKTSNILIKTAPILDLTSGLLELKNVKEIHVVAVENEVKELLWILEKGYISDIKIKTINITKNTIENFNFDWNSNVEATFCLPEKYLYEPNAAIMKSNGFNELSSQYDLNKLHLHSHLYTSNTLKSFYGRVFEIQKSIEYHKSEMKLYLENKKANITTRNFPESVESLRKKWKIKDGGDLYCFFTTDINNRKIVLLCKKL